MTEELEQSLHMLRMSDAPRFTRRAEAEKIENYIRELEEKEKDAIEERDALIFALTNYHSSYKFESEDGNMYVIIEINSAHLIWPVFSTHLFENLSEGKEENLEYNKKQNYKKLKKAGGSK